MKKYSMHEIDLMDGHEFEYFCAELLENSGYEKTEVTPGSGDQGIDVIAYKDGIKFGIQCKCYASDIGNKAVQEAYSGKEFYNCHIGAVLSNRHFTASAIELASKNRILLWNREYLVNLLKNADLYAENDSFESDPVEEPYINKDTSKDNDSFESDPIEEPYINKDTSKDNVSVTDIKIDIDLNQKAPLPITEDNKKYNVILLINDKKVIRNKGRRELAATNLSRITGLPQTKIISMMYRSPSVLATNISKEEAEKIVRSFYSYGCSVYMEESHRTDQEVQEIYQSVSKNPFLVIGGAIDIILAILLFIVSYIYPAREQSSIGFILIILIAGIIAIIIGIGN